MPLHERAACHRGRSLAAVVRKYSITRSWAQMNTHNVVRHGPSCRRFGQESGPPVPPVYRRREAQKGPNGPSSGSQDLCVQGGGSCLGYPCVSEVRAESGAGRGCKRKSSRATHRPASAPMNWAQMNPGTSAGRIPEKVCLSPGYRMPQSKNQGHGGIEMSPANRRKQANKDSQDGNRRAGIG